MKLSKKKSFFLGAIVLGVLQVPSLDISIKTIQAKASTSTTDNFCIHIQGCNYNCANFVSNA